MGTARTGHRETSQRDWLRALEATASVATKPNRLLFHIIEELAQTSPDAPALYLRRLELDLRRAGSAGERVCALGNRAKHRQGRHRLPDDAEPAGIHSDLVGASSSIGIVVALINTQLRGPSLAHCIDAVAPVHTIAAAEFRRSCNRWRRTCATNRNSGFTAERTRCRGSIVRSPNSPAVH